MPVVFDGVWLKDTSLSERGIIATKAPSSTLNSRNRDYFGIPLWRRLWGHLPTPKSHYLQGKIDFFSTGRKMLKGADADRLAEMPGLFTKLRAIRPLPVARSSHTDPGKLAFSNLVNLAGARRDFEAAVLNFRAFNLYCPGLDHAKRLGGTGHQTRLS